MDERDRVDKICGADFELANFVRGGARSDGGGSGGQAARALLRQIEGVRAGRPPPRALAFGRSQPYANPMDWGRKFLANGGCAYIDLDHLELCIPEVRSAWDHVAATRAMLRIARAAQQRANAELPPGQSIQVLVNASDGLGHSYGSHLNVLVTRSAWEQLCERRLHYAHWLASFLVSGVVLTGQGKVGAENGRPAAPFQISQRADFFETLLGPQTTDRRPLVNTRDESHCGTSPLARVHVIFPDPTLCPVASLLRVGLLQIALALVEADAVDMSVCLDDPIEALIAFGRDLDLTASAPLVAGGAASALDLQERFLAAAAGAAADGALDTVPGAGRLLALWAETLDALRRRDWDALAGRLDWVLKRRLLERVLASRRDLDWSARELKLLDLLYASLDPDEGLYWACEAAGAVEAVVDEAHVERFVHEPPHDTRAFTRALLLRGSAEEAIEEVDWGRVVLRTTGADGGCERLVLRLDDPRRWTRAELAARRGEEPARESDHQRRNGR